MCIQILQGSGGRCRTVVELSNNGWFWDSAALVLIFAGAKTVCDVTEPRTWKTAGQIHTLGHLSCETPWDSSGIMSVSRCHTWRSSVHLRFA